MKGKIVLITGGGKGIGRAAARRFGLAGAEIYICGRDMRALKHTALQMREEEIIVNPLPCDVRDADECCNLIKSIKDKSGRLDVLINNAGMSMRGSLEETKPEVIQAMGEINFLGAAYVTHFALPLLRATKGSIVFVSSLTALHGLPMVGPYGASKMALVGLAQSLRAEVSRQGVHVGIIHVGFTENDPGKQVYGSDGSLLPLNRSKNSHTQAQTAQFIYRCVTKRKREMTLTALGNLAAFFYRFFPGPVDFLLSRFAGQSSMYGTDGSGNP